MMVLNGRVWLMMLCGCFLTSTSYSSALPAPVQVQKRLASDGQQSDIFGEAVSAHGSWLAVGARKEDGTAIDGGAVYIFKRGVDGVWKETQRLVANDAMDFLGFGNSVAIHEQWLLVGATGPSLGAPSGSVYVYE